MEGAINSVELRGTIASHPVERMRLAARVTEVRVRVPDPEQRRPLPLPVVVEGTGYDLRPGDEVEIEGRLARRFYRSGAGARSVVEVVASSIRVLEPAG
jgi:hypothetical protein